MLLGEISEALVSELSDCIVYATLLFLLSRWALATAMHLPLTFALACDL